jgi:hypothetical protein
MNDPLALEVTINLLLLGVGGAMFAGNLFALIKQRSLDANIYLTRTIFLTCVGLVITIWSIASLINK